MDIIIPQKNMETIYTFTGWVKKVIDNEHAKILEEIRIDALGDLGKETLVKLAKDYLQTWNNRYPNKKRKYKIAYACFVFSNRVCEKNAIMLRDKNVFTKFIKIETDTR